MKILTLLFIILLSGCYVVENKKPNYKYEIHELCQVFGIDLLIIDRKQSLSGKLYYELIDIQANKYTLHESRLKCDNCNKKLKKEINNGKRHFKHI